MMTVEHTTSTSSLSERLATAHATARRTGEPVLVSHSEPLAAPDPLAVFARARQVAATRIYWASPQNALVLVGVGAAREFTASGPDRFAAIGTAWQRLLSTAVDSDEGAGFGVSGTGAAGQDGVLGRFAALGTSAQPPAVGGPQGPVLLGGFAFDPQGPHTTPWTGFPAGLMVLPRFLLACTPAGATLTTNVVIEPDGDPDAEAARLADERTFLLDSGDTDETDYTARSAEHTLPKIPHYALRITDVLPAASWKKAVAAVAAAIRAGELEKAVLARAVQVDAGRPLDATAALRRLQVGYPDCYLFAVARGTRCFLGATPERLVRLEHGEVQATCLAGSIRRGSDAADDARLGAALLASAKDREEHAVVLRMMSDALRAVCATVDLPEAPVLLRLRNVQHLYTPIRGRLRNGTTLLELVARLHPTPAVGGFPRAIALERIRACEHLDRGWYAGPVGWLDSAGAGEFAVALRSALLHGPTARAFAGCGIMADSDPDAEYAETQMKLRAVLSALEEAQA